MRGILFLLQMIAAGYVGYTAAWPKMQTVLNGYDGNVLELANLQTLDAVTYMFLVIAFTLSVLLHAIKNGTTSGMP